MKPSCQTFVLNISGLLFAETIPGTQDSRIHLIRQANSFYLKEESAVSVNVYHIKGQLVKTVGSAELSAEDHKEVWDGRDTQNRSVASGLYLCRMESDGYTSSQKLLLLK